MTPPRLGLALGSVLAWVIGVAGAWWYLDHAVAAEYRIGARPITDPDSYGLPLVAFALLLGGALVLLNVVLAIVLAWRRRSSRGGR
jgi:hypothetical protein